MNDALGQAGVGEADPVLEGRSLEIYLPDLSGGGTERLHVGLAPYLERAGLNVSLLLNAVKGDLVSAAKVPIVSLDVKRQITGFPRLVRHLKARKPDFLIANMEHMNVMAVLASLLARTGTKVFVSQHTALSNQARRPGRKNKALPWLYRLALPRAAGIVAVSNGVADDLSATTGIRREAVSVIYNGVVTDDFDARANADAPYPWLDGPGPLVVAVGRMVAEKDYPTLLRAFASLAARSPARFLILGEGPLRGELEALAATLGIADRVTMPGFVPNVLSVMSRAQLLVVSSRIEGFGLVIAEALACGLPVVSTDCPHGPAEILSNGAFGKLTRVGDHKALADAMLEALDQPVNRAALVARGREFTVARCASQYLDLLRRAVTRGGGSKPSRRSDREL